MEALRNYWHPVARAADVIDHPVRKVLLDESIVLWRATDQIACMADLCIHRGSQLSQGWVEGDRLTCAYHGWQYGPDGACVTIPSLPEGRSIPRKARAISYRLEERYGLVWVCLGEPAAAIPEHPAYDSEQMTTVLYEPFIWKANAARVIENAMDFTHLPWVHPGRLGDRRYPRYPDVAPVVTETTIAYDVPDERNDSVRHYRVTLPFSLEITVIPNQPSGHSYSMLFTCAPTSGAETTQWFFTSRDWSLHKPDEDWYKFDEIVMDQDRQIVEGQRPELLPLDLTEELHLKGSDSASLEYRRSLRRLGVAWGR
jgi:phenylpropionate dioxygenase-like ring-hydroxylating dioxygenase large terminal subunit